MNSQPDNQSLVFRALTAAIFAERDKRPDLAELFVDFAVELACKGVDTERLQAEKTERENHLVPFRRTQAA